MINNSSLIVNEKISTWVKFFSFLCLFFCIIESQAQTESIRIDFGLNDSDAPWNNLSNPTNGQISNLINSFGLATNVNLAVTDAFHGVNSNGTINPNPVLGIPGTASGDSFFGNTELFSGVIEPTGGITISNLDINKLYTISIFSSRLATDNRETQYSISAASADTLFLQVADNTDTIVTTSVYPKNNGTISISATPGPNNNNIYGFFYLGAIVLEYEADPLPTPSLSLLSPNGGEYWQSGKTATIRWQPVLVPQVILEYSTNDGASWTTIDTLPGIQNSYDWLIPNIPTQEALVSVRWDTLSDQSTAHFEIADDTTRCAIVVIGSSTAEGVGASIPDSAWVNRFRNERASDTRFEVINLARGGYTTYHLLPTGSPIPGGINITVDTERNITKALSFDPFAIIINLPSNDAANNFPVADQMANFRLMTDAAEAMDVPVWVCTTQPRNFNVASLRAMQMEVRDSILAIYGEKAIDFWDGLADPDGFILPPVNSGDGVHLNDAGHKILYERVIDKQLDTLCGYSFVPTNLENPIIDIDILIYPNPFKDVLHFELDVAEAGTLEIKIHNRMGQLLNHQTVFLEAGNNRPVLYLKNNKEEGEGLIFLSLQFLDRSPPFSQTFSLVRGG